MNKMNKYMIHIEIDKNNPYQSTKLAEEAVRNTLQEFLDKGIIRRYHISTKNAPSLNLKIKQCSFYWLMDTNLVERYEKKEFKNLLIAKREMVTPFRYGIIAELENGEHKLIAAATNKTWAFSIRAAITLDTEHRYSDNTIHSAGDYINDKYTD